MRNPTVYPRSGAFHRHLPAFLAAGVADSRAYAGTPGGRTIRDKAWAIGIIALVVTTAVLGGLLLAWEVGHYGEASAAPGNSIVLPLPGPSETVLPVPPSDRATSQAPIDPAALTLWAVPVNLLIFVALGLYLRWDSRRKN